MERQVFVMFDLAFEQEQDHSYCDDIFRQVPDLCLQMQTRQMGRYCGRNYEHTGPGKESGNRDKRTGSGAPVGVPEM